MNEYFVRVCAARFIVLHDNNTRLDASFNGTAHTSLAAMPLFSTYLPSKSKGRENAQIFISIRTSHYYYIYQIKINIKESS